MYSEAYHEKETITKRATSSLLEPFSTLFFSPLISVSHYIAEFTNTLSNIFFITLSLYGVSKVQSERIPFRFILCYLGIALVGFGSFAFHLTLKYEMQMMDELPMLFTSTLLTYSVCETSKGYNRTQKDKRYGQFLAWLLGGSVSLVSLVYAWNRNPVFHQVGK